MSRNRMIKPEFCVSTQLAECSHSARLLFATLWCFCDDNGIHPWNPKQVKMSCFPGDDCTSQDVEGWLNELEKVGLIRQFEAEKTLYLWVTGWQRHQRIDKPTYKYPEPKFSDYSPTAPRALQERSTTARPERKGKETKGKEGKGEERSREERRGNRAPPGAKTPPIENREEGRGGNGQAADEDTPQDRVRRLLGKRYPRELSDPELVMVCGWLGIGTLNKQRPELVGAVEGAMR